MKLYLDIDGCLNPYPRRGSSKDFDDFANHEIYFPHEHGWLSGRTLTVRLSRKMVQELKSLPVEIVFNTTWCDHPDQLAELASHVDLEGTRQLYFEGPEAVGGRDYPWMYYRDQKLLRMIADVQEHGEPFIWIDDEAIDGYAKQTIREDKSLPSNFFCEPNSGLGLTMNDITGIQEFIERVN